MQKHSRMTPDGRAFWYTERLWMLAESLPVQTVSIDSIPEFDENCWFTEPPTCRQTAQHARQILEADLSYPILLHADGGLMDGGHRIAKAWQKAGRKFRRNGSRQIPHPTTSSGVLRRRRSLDRRVVLDGAFAARRVHGL